MLSVFNQQEFNDFILEQNVIGLFEQPITLKSGRLSTWYVNWRTIAEDAYFMDKLTDFVLAFVQHLSLEFDCFYGVPEGASKLGILSQFKWARNRADYGPGIYRLPMGRAKPKEHGAAKDRYFVGMPVGRTILLEDTTTTGNSMLSTLRQLRESNVNVIAAVGLTNRNELRTDGKSVGACFAELGLPYYAMSNALELLPALLQCRNYGSETSKALQDYFAKYGEKTLQLSLSRNQ